MGIRCQTGQRRTHGLSVVPQLPPTPPPAQNLPPRTAAPARRRGGHQLGARCGSLVVEREDPATHSRYTRSWLLAEPGAASARVVDRLTAPVAGCPRSTDGGRGRGIETLPRECLDHLLITGPATSPSAAGIRRALHRSPAEPVAVSQLPACPTPSPSGPGSRRPWPRRTGRTAPARSTRGRASGNASRRATASDHDGRPATGDGEVSRR